MLKLSHTLNNALLLVNHDLVIPVLEQGIAISILELQFANIESAQRLQEGIRESQILLSFLEFNRLARAS